MTSTPSSAGWTIDINTADGHLIQRDSRPHSPWYTYTPADADGIRHYLGCAGTARHAQRLIARHRAEQTPAHPAAARPSTSLRRAR